MRRTPVALLLITLAAPAQASAETVLKMDHRGHVSAREDRFLGAPDPLPRRAAPRASAAQEQPRRTVVSELRALLDAGLIDQATHDRHLDTYDRARDTLRKLKGTRFTLLKAVIKNVEGIAGNGQLSPTRLSGLFLTIERNRAWWAGGPLLAGGRRVTFAGSRLVWQFYPGEGLHVQWLGTFGKANGFFLSGEHDVELRELLDEAIGLAAERAGGIAWEYMFTFNGGRPPWASGLAQGTAIQALSRAAARLAEPRYFEVARAALGVFRTEPPAGVRVATPLGAHYLIYSFAPGLHVLNGFVQALNGLYDFAKFANDEEGRVLFAAGEAQLRDELPRFDTGAWSMYSQRRESDLGYHKLVRDFLRNLCNRLLEAPAQDPTPYCDAAERFTGYLHEPPRLELRSTTARAGSRGPLRFRVSKISTVTVSVLRRGRIVFTRTARFGGGRHVLAFKPATGGPHTVRLFAVDLAGNRGSGAGTLRVRPARRK